MHFVLIRSIHQLHWGIHYLGAQVSLSLPRRNPSLDYIIHTGNGGTCCAWPGFPYTSAPLEHFAS